uniref:PPP1R35_C domain-containing protein n=1 Tax=Heterorhabditis bacteriophora TaxID=37862 RepID=A0A1I7X630_HETBA
MSRLPLSKMSLRSDNENSISSVKKQIATTNSSHRRVLGELKNIVGPGVQGIARTSLNSHMRISEKTKAGFGITMLHFMNCTFFFDYNNLLVMVENIKRRSLSDLCGHSVPTVDIEPKEMLHQSGSSLNTGDFHGTKHSIKTNKVLWASDAELHKSELSPSTVNECEDYPPVETFERVDNYVDNYRDVLWKPDVFLVDSVSLRSPLPYHSVLITSEELDDMIANFNPENYY